MIDPILDARVSALRQSLLLVQRSVLLIDKMVVDQDGQSPELVPGTLRRQLIKQVEELVGVCNEDLNAVEALHHGNGGSQTAAAWQEYALVQERSEELFSGCLEFIGGFAFRNALGRSDASREDRRTAEVADELMVEAANAALSSADGFLTVPACEEALAKSCGRTVRLRFPHWTLLNLPLMAYDFGLVAISDYGARTATQPLMDLLGKKTNEIVESLSQGSAGDADAQSRRGRKAAEHRVRALLADAFAARWMGPAYGCAALHLRFDPSAAFAGNPCYAERARMVTLMLRAMARGTQHTRLVDDLDASWNRAVGQANPPGAVSSLSNDVVDSVHAELEEALMEMSDAARFLPKHWDAARTKYDHWAGRHKKALLLDEEPGPEDTQDTIRVLLNAAWLARIAEPANESLHNAIEHAAMSQCAALASTSRSARVSAVRTRHRVPR